MTTFGHCGVLAVIVLVVLGAVLAERKPSNECNGRARLGKPCNNGAGVCRHAPSGPGEKKGHLKCVQTTTTTPTTTTTTPTTTTTIPTTTTTTYTTTTTTTPTTTTANTTTLETVLTAPGQETGFYNYDAFEEWSFEAPAGHQVKIFIEECEIECAFELCKNASTCNFDYLTLYDGSDFVARLCGYCSPFVYITKSGKLTVSFTSDSEDEYAGFKAVISNILV